MKIALKVGAIRSQDNTLTANNKLEPTTISISFNPLIVNQTIIKNFDRLESRFELLSSLLSQKYENQIKSLSFDSNDQLSIIIEAHCSAIVITTTTVACFILNALLNIFVIIVTTVNQISATGGCFILYLIITIILRCKSQIRISGCLSACAIAAKQIDSFAIDSSLDHI